MEGVTWHKAAVMNTTSHNAALQILRGSVNGYINADIAATHAHQSCFADCAVDCVVNCKKVGMGNHWLRFGLARKPFSGKFSS